MQKLPPGEQLVIFDVLSLADNFENASRASGKFGGVAGVLLWCTCKNLNGLLWNAPYENGMHFSIYA